MLPNDFKVRSLLTEVGRIYTPFDGENPENMRKTYTTPPVGAVHFGIIYMLEVDDDITIKDDEGMINPRFLSSSEALKDIDKYETWSKMIIETLVEVKNQNKL